MSYSFQVRAANKAEAKAAVALKFEDVVKAQACHARDRIVALTTAGAVIDLIEDDDTQDVVVSMNGYLSGTWSGSDVTRIGGVNVSVAANLATRPAA